MHQMLNDEARAAERRDGDNVADNPLPNSCVKLDNSDSYNVRFVLYCRSGDNRRLQLWSFFGVRRVDKVLFLSSKISG